MHTSIKAIVVGLQWGDEGKAKILDELIQKAKQNNNKKIFVVRFQGGPNAGHTMYIRKNNELIKFVTHAAPSGLTSNSNIAIGPHTAFDPEKFLNEVNLAKQLFGYNGDIYISERVGILLDYHRKLDKCQESKTGKIGTTKSGIGPFYMDNANRRTRITFADYISDYFPEKLQQVLELKKTEFKTDIVAKNYFEKLLAIHNPIRKKLKPYACRLEYILNTALKNNENIIIEGAQGTMLDIDMGTVPDQTSSHVLAQNAFASLGLPRSKFKIYGIEKIYPTRVGNGIMPTYTQDDFSIQIQKNAGETGATTKRKRRVGYPDWVIIKYAAMINDLDGIFLTRVDCVQNWNIKFCIAYQYKNKRITEVPLKLKQVKPIYSNNIYSWQLWDGPEDLSDPIRVDKELTDKRKYYIKNGFNSLSNGLKQFIREHNKYIGVPIIGISIGPARGETITNGFPK